MKPFLPLSLTLLALTLTMAGCGEESDDLPEDGRDFDGVGYSESAPYTGRVIDGYLRNARVWLDIDGDSQYTPGPLTVELDSGTTVTLASGEPTAMTGADGEFVLDISELLSDPAVAPDLDPRDYPLFALALPGKTVEQLRQGDVPIERAYLMSAPEGVRNVTPLTTLDRFRKLVSARSLVSAPDEGSASLASVNLRSDYIQSEDHRAHAYARALARFMASQFPSSYNDALAGAGADGTERLLSPEAAYLLGLSLVQTAAEVVDVVDEAAQGHYENVDAGELALPEFPLELADPVVLKTQRVNAHPENAALPIIRSNLMASAELSFGYGPDGRLLTVEANGCMAPSLQEMARLVNAGGRIADTGTQWLPAVSLSLQSRAAFEEEGTDERLTFDWANNEAHFETTTACREGLADSSEFGGGAEVTYSWTTSGGRLEELAEQSDLGSRTLTPDYANETDVVSGYRLSVDGAQQALVSLDGGAQECALEPESADASHVISAQQDYSYTSDDAPEDFQDLRLDYDVRDGRLRLLNYAFTDPLMASLDHVSAEDGFSWILFYPFDSSSDLVAQQPNLIATAYLVDQRPSGQCGGEFGEAPSSAFARVTYEYERLSEHLTRQVE